MTVGLSITAALQPTIRKRLAIKVSRFSLQGYEKDFTTVYSFVGDSICVTLPLPSFSPFTTALP